MIYTWEKNWAAGTKPDEQGESYDLGTAIDKAIALSERVDWEVVVYDVDHDCNAHQVGFTSFSGETGTWVFTMDSGK